MSDDELARRLTKFEHKLDMNTRVTNSINDKLNVHMESHKAIDQHVADVRRVVFQEPEGLIGKARDCWNFQSWVKDQFKSLDKVHRLQSNSLLAWIGIGLSGLTLLVLIATALVAFFHK